MMRNFMEGSSVGGDSRLDFMPADAIRLARHGEFCRPDAKLSQRR